VIIFRVWKLSCSHIQDCTVDAVCLFFISVLCTAVLPTVELVMWIWILYIVTCIGVFLLTQTCHMSGYPRQVINVDAAWMMMVYLYLAALQTIIPHGNYNTCTGICLRRCDLTSPPLLLVFSDNCSLLESDTNWLCLCSDALTVLESSMLTDSTWVWSQLTDSLINSTFGQYREHLVQGFCFRYNGSIPM
jgi:hypothetical protein